LMPSQGVTSSPKSNAADLSAQTGAVARLGSSPKRHFNANEFPNGDTGKYPVSLPERAGP
jgi:hypothetical protein